MFLYEKTFGDADGMHHWDGLQDTLKAGSVLSPAVPRYFTFMMC